MKILNQLFTTLLWVTSCNPTLFTALFKTLNRGGKREGDIGVEYPVM